MDIPDKKLDHIIDLTSRAADAAQQDIENDEIDVDELPSTLNGLGKYFRKQGQCYALLGNSEQAREGYTQAAQYKWESVQAMRDHREELPPNLWEDAPAIYADGMLFALIGRDEDLVHDIAAEAIELDESYLETFGESAGSQLRYYNAKLLAATILDDDRWEDLLSGYIEAVGQIVPTEIREQKHVASDLRARLYGALYNREGELFASVFEKYLRGYAANTPLDTDDPEELLNDELTALCLLANDRGINVTIDSPFVPDVLVPDPSEAIHVVEVH